MEDGGGGKRVEGGDGGWRVEVEEGGWRGEMEGGGGGPEGPMHQTPEGHTWGTRYLFDGLPLEGAVLTDEAVRHTDEVLAQLPDRVPDRVLDRVLDRVPAVVRLGVSSQRQQLEDGHHVGGLQSPPMGVLQGPGREVQQDGGLGPAAQGLLGQHRLGAEPQDGITA
ncbi:hypothetical protein EYF80_063085 [Liparis tanakae]|uniref:Uncharacterized protein n=1 Tax=Liparis tanakae TaxID=230148 RepID=A0A4Z2ED45_9TELE|nr:hypothetical protein EYF80_063085 [Liparis tanakae]